MNDKISIIVPVYNVEDYLEECIESIINQTYKNIEIIIINDGSTDNSGVICDKYSKKDKRIRVFHQENKGVSSARNFGIKNATGKYIMFVDADDYLELNTIEALCKHKLKDSLVIFGYNKIYKNKIIEKKENNFNVKTKLEMTRMLFFNDNIGGFIANKIFDKRIIDKNSLLFNEELSYCEDLVFVCEYIKYITKFKYINCSLYNYRMRKSSTSYSFFTGNNINIFDAYDLLLKKNNDLVIVNNIKYRYIESYYIFRRFLGKKKINLSILNEERDIVKKNCKSVMSIIKFIVIKYFYQLGLLYKKIEIIRFKLFE